MQQNVPSRPPAPRPPECRRLDRGTRTALWAAWALAVAATAYLTWHAAVAAGQPLSRLALLIHCTLAGLVGLVVITWIEIRVAGPF